MSEHEQPAWSSKRHPLAACLLGLLLFLVVGRGLAGPLSAWLGWSDFAAQLALKVLLFACAWILIVADRRPTSHFGVRRSTPGTRWRWLAATALGLGVLSTTVITISPAQGMANLGSFGLLELVLAVWIVSSVAEEFLARGLVYGWITPTVGTWAGLPVPVVATALMFGAMHLTLLLTPTDRLTVVIVLVSTTLLGVLCGLARHRSGSLWPAIWVHVLFNVGGAIGGALMVILGWVEVPPR